MTELNYENFPDVLRRDIPGFSRIYDEHVRNYDEVLPHVLLGDLVRFLSDELRRHGPQSAALRSALPLLEQGMGSTDPMLQELIAVSFIENLEPALTLAIRTSFGPHLEEQYRTRQAALGQGAH